MSTKNTQSGERLSFYKLIIEKSYRVLIPIIQRDYAQGRTTAKEVRKTFLDALCKYLEENKPNRDLDFVYGSLNERDGQTDFIPLDGQQRLTTLFLLHWYLYQISDVSEKKADFKNALCKEGKSMFTYETRSSSSEFCDALMSNNIDFANLIENSLSKTIENSSWYFLSWKQDPTIQSMLTMLDAIHKKFADKKEFFERLIDTDNPIITFQFLNLQDFKLTDDLYIKMNSRGKPLTPFENFKAKFEQYLESIEPANRPFELELNETKKNVSLRDYFSYNIDTKWANLFWNYRELVAGKNKDGKNTYDDELKNFIRVIFTNQYAITVTITKDKTDDSFEFLLGTQPARKRPDYTDDISFYKYDELKVLSECSVLYLVDAFDNLVNGNNKLQKYLSDDYKFYFDEEAVFENALKHSFANNQERVMFHAYIRYLIKNKTDRSGIAQWMRVIHNLAYNTIIDGTPEIARAIKSIENLLPNSNNILEHLKTNPSIDGFASWQIKEEKIKAHLIAKSTGNDWKTKIEEAEKHSCFDGQIGFILEFAGIVDYYQTNKNCDWNNDKTYFDAFVNYAEKSIGVFVGKDSYDKDFLLERAVLTKGIYAIKSTQTSIATVNRFNLLHTNTIANNIARDYSWKRLLRIEDEDKKEKRSYLKEVFIDEKFNINEIKISLENICKTLPNDWRDYFIMNPKLMRYCTKGFIKVDDEDKIYLLESIYQGANQYFAEMYTYYLWITEIKNNTNITLKKDYHKVKSIDEEACIVLKICHNRINYTIDIYWRNAQYEICIYEENRSYRTESDYPQEMQDLLKITLEFSWDTNKYLFVSGNGVDIKTKVEELEVKVKKIE
jgi:hypothetical protein